MNYNDKSTGPLFELAQIVATIWNANAAIEPFTFTIGVDVGAATGAADKWSGGENSLYVGRVIYASSGSDELAMQCSRENTTVRLVDGVGSGAIDGVFDAIRFVPGLHVVRFIGYRLTRR